MKSNKTNARNITVLDAITAIRLRPQMYIGDISGHGITNMLLQEILCISLDKAHNGCATKINISFSDAGIITVKDNGFPIGITNNHDERLIEVLLTQLFACRNLKPHTDFCKNGIVVSNALSEFFLYDCGDGENHWQQTYQFGMPINSLRKISQTDEIWEQFSFLPDKKLIPHSKVETESFVDWLESKSLSIKNCKFFLNDKTVNAKRKIK